MKLRIGAPGTQLTALGEGTGLVIEKAVEIAPIGAEVDEILMGQINDGLMDQLRIDLGYLTMGPEWVELRTTLTRYLVRRGNDFVDFPFILGCLRALAYEGCKKSLIGFLELADQLPMEKNNIEIFLARLLSLDFLNPVKNPLAVLTSFGNIDPDNWQEAIAYMDLIIEVDLTMAEFTSMYVEQFKDKSPFYVFFLLQIARTGRLEAIDKFVELLPILERRGEDICKEMKPVMDLIGEEKMAEAEMLLVVLLQAYEGQAAEIGIIEISEQN